MKKEMIKALSLGLSAVTLAGSMDITAFAAEDDGNVAENQQTTEGQQQETTSAEQAIVQETQAVSADINGVEGQPAIDGQAAVEAVPGVIDVVNEIKEANPDIPKEATTEEAAKIVSDAQDATDDILDQDYQLNVDLDEDGNFQRDENGDLVVPESSDIVAYGNMGDTLEDAYDEVKDAAEAIDGNQAQGTTGVIDDVNAINTQAGVIDGIDADINTTISNAEGAAQAADEETTKAEAAVNLAVESVKNDPIEVAEQNVNAAAQTLQDAKDIYDKQKSYVEECRKEYEAALTRRSTALQNYENLKADALADDGKLAEAQKNLDDANDDLLLLEAALKEAEKDFEGTAEYLLLQAENNEDLDTADYIQVILKNKVFVGQDITVESISSENQTDDVAFVVKNSDGNIVGRYAYTAVNGVVSIYSTEKMYEFDCKDENGEDITISKTASEMEQLVTDGGAVKRVAIPKVDENGNPIVDENGNQVYRYESYSALSAEEQAKADDGTYSWEFIVLNNTELSADNLVSGRTLEENESVTTQGTAVASFDPDGNYILTVTNTTTKKIYTYVNGVLQDVTDQKVTTADGTNAEVKTAAQAKYAELLAAKIADIQANGFTGYDKNGNPVTFTKDEIKGVGSESVLQNPEIYWTVDGFYVPVYTDHGVVYCKEEVKGSWLADLFHMDRKAERIAEKYQEENPNVWVKGNANLFEGVAFYASVEFVNSYDINLVDASGALNHYADRDAAIAAVTQYAISQNQQAYHEEFSWGYWTGGIISIWVPYPHFENEKYNYTVSGIATTDGYDSKIVTDSYYSFTQDADIKIETHQSGVQNLVYKAVTAAVSTAYRKSGDAVFTNTDTDYQQLLSDAKVKLDAYNELIKDTDAAQKRVETCKNNVDTIKQQIEALDKGDVAKNAALVAEWDKKLADAEQKLADAEQTLNDSSDALDKAKDELDQKKKELEDNQNQQNNETTGGETSTGGETTTGGGAGRRYYPTTAPIDTVFDPSVVFIDNPVVPLAGDTTTTATRTVNRNTDVADADADTITVDDGNVPLAVDDAAVEETEDIVDEVSILPEETPLAGGTQENFFQQSWWWLLLILIVAIGGGTAYAKKKAKDAENTTK